MNSKNKKNIINGFYYSNKILYDIKKYIKNNKPSLTIINTKKNITSHMYIKNKIFACKKTNLKYQIYNLTKNISQLKLTNLIFKLNKQKNINGIILQLPLLKIIKKKHIFININIKKDIDGLNPINIGKRIHNNKTFKTCTSLGITYIIKKINIQKKNLTATIVGTSITVGRPIIIELLKKNISVITCNKFTKNIKKKIKKSKILISAIGKRNIINKYLIKNKIIIIDIGINKKKNKITGDINFKNLKQKTKNITPVPGGLGPITVAMLLKNTFKAHIIQNN